MEALLGLFVKAVFVENMLLAFFLGMCSFLACSRRVETALGLGAAVVFVLGVTVPINWCLHRALLRPGALAWLGLGDVDLSFLTLVTFITVVAATVQLVELVTTRHAPALQARLGVFLPLITVNCAILGASLFAVERRYGLAEATVFGLGSGVGWALAIAAMASAREKLRYSNVPPALRGLGITMLLTGLMAMAFLCFAGVRL